MNRALNIKNWKDGGNDYILKGNPKNKWVGFQNTVLTELYNSYGDNFNIVIWTDEQNEEDYYCIPYNAVKHPFIDEHKTTGKYINRWTAIILDHQFLMHSNTKLSVDISGYYAKPLIAQSTITLDEDYFIENARAEINIRLGQSKFRKGVLNNFNYKCALTGISEISLLTASHIIPWSQKKEFRADISNGLCLYIEYDILFDKGYISFTNNLEVIITNNFIDISKELKEKLCGINGRILKQPLLKSINTAYLEYHRKQIFKG